MKKTLSLLLVLCLLFSLTACGGDPSKKPDQAPKKSHYLVSSKTFYRNDEVVSETIFTYDQQGRPLTAKATTKSLTMEVTLTYDEHGNRIKETFFHEANGNTLSTELNYHFTYDNGRAIHCDYSDSRLGDVSGMGFDLEYDANGNLVYVEYSQAYAASFYSQWHLFEYDSQNRLSREVACQAIPTGPDVYSYFLHCDTYHYEGNSVTITESHFDDTAPISRENLASITLTPSPEESSTFFFDQDGNLISSTKGEATYEGDQLCILGEDGYVFDEHGNMLSSGDRTDYAYEAIELTDEEWNNAKQLMHGGMSTIVAYTFLYFTQDPIYCSIAPLIHYSPCSYCPVYYLVPYPQW